MIEIIQENHFFIVLKKDSGVSVHNQSPSVTEYLESKNLATHFVNRLDQDTSGLIVVAKSAEFHHPLSLALQNGQKIYRALLRSPWKQSQNNGVWNWPLTDKAEGLKNPQGSKADRKQCETHYSIVRTNQYFTEILATIKTGRQHQIRKHCALAKHPIVGDQRYNEAKYNKLMEKFYKNERLLLHAESLAFEFNKQSYHFTTEFSLDFFFEKLNV